MLSLPSINKTNDLSCTYTVTTKSELNQDCKSGISHCTVKSLNVSTWGNYGSAPETMRIHILQCKVWITHVLQSLMGPSGDSNDRIASVETFLPTFSSFQSTEVGVGSVSRSNMNHCGIQLMNIYPHALITCTPQSTVARCTGISFLDYVKLCYQNKIPKVT
jgi:hypothetical protein